MNSINSEKNQKKAVIRGEKVDQGKLLIKCIMSGVDPIVYYLPGYFMGRKKRYFRESVERKHNLSTY